MPTVVLDTNILLEDPTVLARSKPGVKLIVPVGVLQQAERHRTGRLTELIRRAASEKQIRILRAQPHQELAESFNTPLDEIDAQTLALARELAKAEGETVIATRDKILQREALSVGVKSIDLTELRQLLSKDTPANPALLELARKVISDAKWHIGVAFFAGILATVAGSFAITYLNVILRWLTLPGTIAAFAAVGLMAYWTRCKWRLTYGVVEYLFGLLCVIYALTYEFPKDGSPANGILKLVAGLYIMVRGLDNIGKALDNTKHKERWRRWFPE